LPEKLKRSNTEPKTSRKRRSAAALNPTVPKEAKSFANSKSNTPPNGNVQRASTLPTPLKITAATRHSVSFDSPRFPKSAPADQSFRKSFHELISPIDMSTTATLDSTTSGPPLQAQYDFNPHFDSSNGIPDLGALIFPSADPFAYPGRSMTDLSNRQVKTEPMGGLLDNSSSMPNMYLPNGLSVSNPFDSLEGQLFGPLPPYLTQNQANMNISGIDMNCIAGMDLRDMRVHTGLTPGEGLNFDEIFGEGNEQWNHTLESQMYMQ
jgi:hypothetical protein